MLREQFGDIDIHVFDALLQGYWKPPARFLDAGCGTGRNLPFFLKQGFDVYGVDADADALEIADETAKALLPGAVAGRFLCRPLEAMDFADDFFDAVLCNAVLHFAENQEHFASMLQGIWRVVKPGGTVLIRMGTRIGLETEVLPRGKGLYTQPDGACWYLPDAAELRAWENRLGAERWKPLKSTWVEKKRSMATWWLRKPVTS